MKPHTQQDKQRIDIKLKSNINKFSPLDLPNTLFPQQLSARTRDSSKYPALPSYLVNFIKCMKQLFPIAQNWEIV